MKDLTKGSITKILFSFALPVFIGNLFNLAYNLADMRIVGSYLGNDALAAVGSVSTLSDLIINFILGIANGFAVITSRFFGMGDYKKVKKTFGVSISVGLTITAIIMIFALSSLTWILSLLNVSPEHTALSTSYISIIIKGLLFTYLYNCMAASLRATGDSYTPLMFLIFSAILNVVLDLYCVGHLGLGVKGAATATIISQLVSVIICIIYTYIKYPTLRLGFSDLLPTRKLLSEMLPAGFSMGLMSSLVAFGTLTLQSAINSLGTNTIVAHSSTRKITSLYMLPFGAFGTTMATFSGQNFGAGQLPRIKEALRKVLIINYAWCLMLILVTYTIYPLMIVGITDTSIQEVINTAWLYQKVDILFYMLVPTINILRNMLQGIGDHVTPIISSMLELTGKLIIALAFTPIFGYWAVIMSEPIVWIIMVIPLIISSRRRLKTINIKPL